MDSGRQEELQDDREETQDEPATCHAEERSICFFAFFFRADPSLRSG